MAHPEKVKAKFLAGLCTGLSVSGAAEKAGAGRRTLYNWREDDEDFKALWDEAIEIGTDSLEDEALRRAKDGTLEPVYQGGEKVGEIRKYSDTLAIFMLKARRPEKFKDRVQHDNTFTGDLVDELTAAIKRATEKP